MERDEWSELRHLRRETLRAERRERLGTAALEFQEFARLACLGDLTLRSPIPTHWTLARSRGKVVILQFWPSAERVQMQGDRKSRPCTLEQLRAIMRDKLGCGEK